MKINHRILGATALAACASLPGFAQTSKPAPSTSSFSIYESFQGSPSSQGQIYQLDNSLRYTFSPTFDVALGMPVYMARGGTTNTSGTGLGDAYLTLDLVPVKGELNWMTTLTGYAPTGNTSLGFSTGRALFTWNNHLEHEGDLLSPYVDAGFGNTVPDLATFTRPYKTLGKVGTFDAGGRLALLENLDLNLSTYADTPIGTQKVFSRLVHKNQGGSGGGFRNSHETSGGAGIARDEGYSAVVEASPRPFLDLSLGFTRSTHLDINAATFSVGVNVTRLLGSSGSH